MQIANEELQLAAEAQLLKEKNQELEAERDELLAKVSELKPYNVRQRKRRKQKVINDQCKLMKSSKKTLKHVKRLQKKLLYFIISSNTNLNTKLHYHASSCSNCEELEAGCKKSSEKQLH